MSVPARLSIVTLGVRDVARAAAFYEQLGWERTSSSSDEICWFRTSGPYVGLFGRDALAQDAQLPPAPPAPFSGVTLAINVEGEEAVLAALEEAVAAGGRIIKPARKAEWGGFSGYFADPDGHAWEVAFNPFFPIDASGRITIP